MSTSAELLVSSEEESVERLDWLVRLRWLGALGIATSTLLAWLLFPDQIPLLPLVLLALIVVLYNTQLFAYARFLRSGQPQISRGRQIMRLISTQFILDTVVLVALIHLSGGAESPAVPLLVLPVILASMLLSRRDSLLVTALAAVLLAGSVGLEYLQVLPHHHPPVLQGIELYQQANYLLVGAAWVLILLGLVHYLASSIRASARTEQLELACRLESTLAECQELETVNLRLQRLDSERTRFLTTVTHELRAPINTIHMCVELALAGYASPEKVREILERVKIRTAELSDLVGDLLRLARAREEADRDEGIGLVQPGEVLQGVVNLMRAEAHAKDLFLSTDIGAGPAPIRANLERLKLVWTNLLSNAIKYTEPGGIVAVTLNQTAEHVVGTVQDTGIGIPPQDLHRIFEEFYRAENARAASPSGTGVGLAIVRRIVEGWGGQITVKSELGLGSKFTLILPRADVPARHSEPATPGARLPVA